MNALTRDYLTATSLIGRIAMTRTSFWFSVIIVFLSSIIMDRSFAIELSAGALLGGSGSDSQEVNQSVAVSPDGSIVIFGSTTSVDFPVTSGSYDSSLNADGTVAQDLFVAKFSPDLTELRFSTLLGGSEAEYASSVTIGQDGSIYLIGRTDSIDFPVTVDAFQGSFQGGVQDGFLVKLSSDGSTLLYSTYLGGSSTDWGRSIALDSLGRIYTLSETWSSNWPITSSAVQISRAGRSEHAITIFDSSMENVLYSTFLGGSSDERGAHLRLDSDGSIFITGFSRSTDYPTTSGVVSQNLVGDWDAFVTKITNDWQSIEFSTYIGGTGYETCRGTELDSDGSVWISGSTQSSDFPISPVSLANSLNGTTDAYLLKLSSDGSSIVYSTFIGGSDSPSAGNEVARSIALLSGGNIAVTINTHADDFPTVANFTNYAGGSDIVVALVNPGTNTILYSSYIGGANFDGGNTLATGSNEKLLLTGLTENPDFPIPPSSIYAIHSGALDVFLIEFDFPLAVLEGEIEGTAEGEVEGLSEGTADEEGEIEGYDEPVGPVPGMSAYGRVGVSLLFIVIFVVALYRMPVATMRE